MIILAEKGKAMNVLLFIQNFPTPFGAINMH